MKLVDADALFALYEQEYKSCLHVHRRERAAGFQGELQLLYDAPTVCAVPENDSEQLCADNENFIQNKFGYCFYALGPAPLVYNLYVHPQYRRHGHSRVLLKLVIAEIRKSGYKGKISIQAEPRENSIGLKDLTKYYKGMGFAVLDARKSEGSEKQ